MAARLVVSLLVLSLASGAAMLYVIGGSLAEPYPRTLAVPKSDLPLEPVAIPRADGGRVAGWFASGSASRGGVLLVHGIRGDRRSMLPRARFLSRAGYSVLMIDLQAHGETPGEWITFGFRESRDVAAAAAYLKDRLGGRPVGVVGVSLGGAAALLGPSPVAADAVVLEGVYSTIGRAVGNRLATRLGEVGRLLAPLLVWQIKPRLDVRPGDLMPLAAISRLKAPVMVIGGTADRRTQPDEVKALYLRARSPKRLWLVDGARHEDLHRRKAADYEQRVLAFFAEFLVRAPSEVAGRPVFGDQSGGSASPLRDGIAGGRS